MRVDLAPIWDSTEDESMRIVVNLLGVLLLSHAECWLSGSRRRRVFSILSRIRIVPPCYRVNCQVRAYTFCLLLYLAVFHPFDQVSWWSSWWGSKCGFGRQYRYRSVLISARCGGSSCPSTSVGTRLVKTYELYCYGLDQQILQ